MYNYKLTIQYDGSLYKGWQIQVNEKTIQQTIIESIKVILKEDVNLIGSGRTDAGVHALGQVANFRTENQLDLYKFKHSLNAVLPDDISVSDICEVHEGFHSRYDARSRVYLYLITKNKSPFYKRYSYHYHGHIDCCLLNEYAKEIIGKKDFSSFSRKNTETENKICSVYDLKWRAAGTMVILRIEADRFLHGMVRTIAGTLLRALTNNPDSSFIRKIIEARDREAAGEAVPAQGLFLYKVNY